MALLFAGATTDKVTIPNPLTLGSGSAFSYLMWMFLTAAPANSQGTSKGGVDLFVFFNVWFMEIPRATTAASAMLPAGAGPALDVWSIRAGTYDETDGPRLFFGYGMTEETYDPPRTIGEGATTADSNDLWIGNRSAVATLAPPQRVAIFALFNARLTATVLAGMTRFPWKMKTHPNLVGAWELGFSTGAQRDWTGVNNGTVTGATLAEHIPLLRYAQVVSL